MIKSIFLIFTLAIAAGTFAQTDILNENFQAGFPTGWTVVDVDQQVPAAQVSEYTSAWIIKSDPENLADSAISSTSFYSPVGRANKWLITPPITLGNYGNFLSFRAKSFDPSFPDNYKILISTSSDVASFTDTIRLVVLENPTWTTREFNLSNLGFNGVPVYLAFVNTTNDGFKLFLDDIRVRKEDPVNVVELAEIEASIYPNPAGDHFKIQSELQIERVFIYSSEGKLLTETNYKSGKSIDISQMQAGVYFVKIKAENQYKTVRLIKK